MYIQYVQGLGQIQAQYSRSCPIISCFFYNDSCITSDRTPWKTRPLPSNGYPHCCHARLSRKLFTARCIATNTERTHRENCCYYCVFVVMCLLRRCLAKGSIRHNIEILTMIYWFLLILIGSIYL
jgi:hypothetical protein